MKQFVLGEYKDSPYTARLRNAGKDTIYMDVVLKDGGRVQETMPVAPGKSMKWDVDPSTQLHFRNPNGRQAKVVANLSENVPGMRYIDLDDDRYQRESVAPQNAAPKRVKAELVYNFSQSVKIPAGQTATFSPEVAARFSANILNRGQLEVRILDRKTGSVTQGFGTGRRASNTVYLHEGEVLTLINTSTGTASLTLELTEDLRGFQLSSKGDEKMY